MIDFHSCTPIAAPDCFLVLSVVPAVNKLIFNSTGLWCICTKFWVLCLIYSFSSCWEDLHDTHIHMYVCTTVP